jgi:hypothetical protein
MSKIPILQSKNSNQKENTIDSKELVKKEEDDYECKISNLKYNNLRLLIERKDRDLNELREFANFERESLESILFEQQSQLQKQIEKEKLNESMLATNGLTVKTEQLDKVILYMYTICIYMKYMCEDIYIHIYLCIYIYRYKYTCKDMSIHT